MTMQTHAARMAAGGDGQAELKQLLLNYGFLVVDTGQESWLPNWAHQALRQVHDDATVRSVRYQPDLLAWSPRFPFSFWDAKVNATPGTPNFTIEQACYQEQLARMTIGQRIVIAFRDTDGKWSANSVGRLQVVDDHSARRHDAAGSQTPYLLISKRSTVPLHAFVAIPSWSA